MSASQDDTATISAAHADALARMVDVVGPEHALADPSAQTAYLHELRGLYTGAAALVLRPRSTAEVSALLSLANGAGIGVVPQGGNTGLVGGQIPKRLGGDDRPQVVMSLSRMNRVRAVEADGGTMIVEAGVTLAQAQTAADSVGRLFPLSLASEDSCQIGGVLATNAGGVGVLAYGNARALALGLEVITADGRVWEGLRTLKKDNTGYDLRDLFIGSEGTLGVITAAALKLFPRPAETAVAFAALPDLQSVGALFSLAEARAHSGLTAFEFMSAFTLDLVTRHVPGNSMPMKSAAPWYVLIELSSHEAGNHANERMERLLSEAIARGIVRDATVATSLAQQKALWRLRESASEAQRGEGGSIKHDVSVPVARIAEFVAKANATVERICPGARPVVFGHFGDGNVHYNVTQPAAMDKQTFLELWSTMTGAVHGVIASLDGSISAEHGIGQMKRDDLRRFKGPLEIELMQRIKDALDPNGILNPGKVL